MNFLSLTVFLFHQFFKNYYKNIKKKYTNTKEVIEQLYEMKDILNSKVRIMLKIE